jgi:hypothetical protein
MGSDADQVPRGSLGDPSTEHTLGRGALSRDRLAYMADLLLELRDMAAAEGQATLCGLLALAEAEARRHTR